MNSPITVPASNTLVELLERVPTDRGERSEWRAHLRRLVWPLGLAIALLGAWSATAPLAGAVVANAQLKVELNRKTVQHQEGGLVRQILVRNGQWVHAGEALLVIGDLRQDAELGVLQDQWQAARLRVARAEAQSRLAPHFDVPAELQRAAPEHAARELALFKAQRHALDEQGALLAGQMRELQSQVAALETQIAATGESVQLSDQELALNNELASQGFVSRARLIGLQRNSADYRSRIGEQRGDLAAARQRVAELQTRHAQLRLSMQTQATDELKEATARVRELEERLRPSKDGVDRQTVRAPVDGEVMGLRVAAVGAAIAPREPLLDIVPSREKLIVEARIAPQDIEHVRAGSAAEVRLASADARNSPPLPAKVIFVSADRVQQPETGQAWFEITAEVDATALRGDRGGPALRSGMPVELYVTTGQRTLLEYFAKPLGLFTRRALRES